MKDLLPDGYRWAKPTEVFIASAIAKPDKALRIIVDHKGRKRLAVPKK